MPYPTSALVPATTASGFLLVLSLVVPMAGVLLAFLAGGHHIERIAFATMPLGFAIAVATLVALWRAGGPLVYLLGGWAPPLGVALRADGLSAVMMMTVAVVICAVGVYAYPDFRSPAEGGRAPSAFWLLLLAIWGALNTVFLGGDLFTLYVALELVTFAAVPLVCLEGRAETFQAALRYLLFALFGSVLYLVGTALFYRAYGALDIVLLSHRIHADPVTLVAAALMTAGLLAKSALFPLHFWLPPAHAGAPAAGSAILSALVVKASFFIAVRLWFDVMPGLMSRGGAQLLAGLGGAAIVLGSVVALRQERLKLLVAYSTLAQIGYLFLMFPLGFGAGPGPLESGGALTGGMIQTISHATAKAAMFMAVGLIYAALGHDRIAGLGGTTRALPLSVFAFALSGLALIGVPLSGVYFAKGLLLQAADETQQWWWAIVIQAGAFFTSGYVVLVLVHALAPADEPIVLRVPLVRVREAAALTLALCSLLLGLLPWGRYLFVPPAVPLNVLSFKAAAAALWPIMGGGVLAILLGRWKRRPAYVPFGKLLVAIVDPLRRIALVLAGTIEEADSTLRQWPAAAFSLLVLAILFGVALAATS
ncbi:MAG TPA: proton-conducting transporter membrane subunit [Xanthobacteraceae bacterium]|jgi:formate hydrogenlyase subunit 3/multisubunit Na+/H+ antiporter MnhD subunit